MRVICLMTLLAGAQGHLSSQSGKATYYSPGVFAQVAHHRGMALRNDVSGYAAVLNCAYIGHTAYASINHDPVESYQVLDCVQTRDRASHIRSGLIIEVDYKSAV